jgi:hypothetical protein
MDSVLTDGLLIFGGLVILLAPLTLALADTGPGGAGWKLLTFLCCTFAAWFFFRLKSAHRACGVAPSVGMQDGQANEFQSTTPCMTLTTSMAEYCGQRGEAAGVRPDVT